MMVTDPIERNRLPDLAGSRRSIWRQVTSSKWNLHQGYLQRWRPKPNRRMSGTDKDLFCFIVMYCLVCVFIVIIRLSVELQGSGYFHLLNEIKPLFQKQPQEESPSSTQLSMHAPCDPVPDRGTSPVPSPQCRCHAPHHPRPVGEAVAVGALQLWGMRKVSPCTIFAFTCSIFWS
jgi:hypothetical protein